MKINITLSTQQVFEVATMLAKTIVSRGHVVGLVRCGDLPAESLATPWYGEAKAAIASVTDLAERRELLGFIRHAVRQQLDHSRHFNAIVDRLCA